MLTPRAKSHKETLSVLRDFRGDSIDGALYRAIAYMALCAELLLSGHQRRMEQTLERMNTDSSKTNYSVGSRRGKNVCGGYYT